MNHAEQSRLSGFPEPRAFQVRALDRLREGVKAGHRCQMLVAPTGAGKTFIGMYLLSQALSRGKRGMFVCDRRTLIEQTSATADRYGLLDHGVIMASHHRFRPHAPLQIASVQTLARRSWPDADVIIIDEAHTQLKAWTEHIPNVQSAVVGLSATPYSDGLGRLFSNVVNAATMRELTELGVLVPMRVLSCTRADMKGAETSGGEWTDRAAEERGMEIVGDVVAEWLKYGEGRKTIVFAATINHCQELERQFRQHGVAAATFTSETTAAERESLLRDYRADASLRVLISVEALAKGFDVPDVGCVVDCRPLRKSLSTAIQMWGRGLRSSPDTGKTDCILLDHCIASGQRILTNEGLVAIEAVTKNHLLWDGHEFVRHGGVVSRGVRPVIRYAGLTATADHPVKTAQGWRTLGQCADEQIAIVTTGVGGTALRECDGYFSRSVVAWPALSEIHSCALRVRRLWLSLGDLAQQLARWAHEGLSNLQPAQAVSGLVVRAGTQHEATVHEPKGSAVEGLRRPRDRVPFRLRDHLRSLDRAEPGRAGGCGSPASGPRGQQRALRAGEHSVGSCGGKSVEHAAESVECADAQFQAGAPGGAIRRFLTAGLSFSRAQLCGDRRALEHAEPQAERQVWDVLDCGPRNSFTCEGLLVHNSGNIVRFRNDFEDIFHNGLSELDDGKKLDRRVREEDEDEQDTPSKCPACGYTPFAKRCMACGHELPPRPVEAEASGGMMEIFIGKARAADNPRHLYAQCVTYARLHSAPEKQRGRAAHIYRDITGAWPPRLWGFDEVPETPVSRAVLNKIKQKNIAFARGRA